MVVMVAPTAFYRQILNRWEQFSPSRPTPPSVELVSSPTLAFSIGDIGIFASAIPVLPIFDEGETPPASSEEGSGTIVGSGIISIDTIAQEQKRGDQCSTNASVDASSPPHVDGSWTDGGGKLTPLTYDASRAELKEPQQQSLKTSMAQIWGGMMC